MVLGSTSDWEGGLERVVCISMQQLEGSIGSCLPVKISEIASVSQNISSFSIKIAC